MLFCHEIKHEKGETVGTLFLDPARSAGRKWVRPARTSRVWRLWGRCAPVLVQRSDLKKKGFENLRWKLSCITIYGDFFWPSEFDMCLRSFWTLWIFNSLLTSNLNGFRQVSTLLLSVDGLFWWLFRWHEQSLGSASRYKANIASNAGAGAVVSKFERDVLYPMKRLASFSSRCALVGCDWTCFGNVRNLLKYLQSLKGWKDIEII